MRTKVCKLFSVTIGTGVAGSIGDGSSATSAQLVDPRGIALDTIGNVYISEFTKDCVRKVSIFGVISMFAGTTLKRYRCMCTFVTYVNGFRLR